MAKANDEDGAGGGENGRIVDGKLKQQLYSALIMTLSMTMSFSAYLHIYIYIPLRG